MGMGGRPGDHPEPGAERAFTEGGPLGPLLTFWCTELAVHNVCIMLWKKVRCRQDRLEMLRIFMPYELIALCSTSTQMTWVFVQT